MSKSSGSKGRGRNRNNSGKRPQGRGGNYDPNMGRSRGNAQQLMDKYLSLARDAASQGDRIAAENYFQHADHYYRIVHARNEQQEARRRANDQGGGDASNDPIPVQGGEKVQGPVELVGNDGPAGRGEAKEKPKSKADDKADNKADVAGEPTKEKKPRRGRPPKKANADQDAATEAAE